MTAAESFAPTARRPESTAMRFLRGFIENPRQVGSILPSSTAVQRRLRSLPCLHEARTVVELGPGLGETTAALLEAIPRHARLLSIDVVPEFVDHLGWIDDPRLRAELGDALQLQDVLQRYDATKPDVVVSGIPVSHLSVAEGRQLIAAIHDVLVPGGTFVAYQFRNRIRDFADEFFESPHTTFVPWNIPPLDIYEWTKSAAVKPVDGNE